MFLNSIKFFRFNGILAGIDLGFDTATSSFAKRNASLGFSGSDYRCVLNV